MTHSGKVVEVKPDGQATVRLLGISPTKSCVGCTFASSCIPTDSDDSVTIKAAVGPYFANIIRTGSRVHVESRTKPFGAALILFGLPLSALTGAATIAKTCGTTDGTAAVSALAACAITMVITILLRRYSRHSPLWLITEIIDDRNQTSNI